MLGLMRMPQQVHSHKKMKAQASTMHLSALCKINNKLTKLELILIHYFIKIIALMIKNQT